MAKRPLGLGKSHEKKNKKKKVEKESNSIGQQVDKNNVLETASAGDQLMIKFSGNSNELAQLWMSYAKRKIVKNEQDKNENSDQLVLNGIIHECDRLLRKYHNQKNHVAKSKKENEEVDEEVVELNGQLYAIYGLALGELAYFQTLEDEEQEDKEYNEEEEAKQNAAKAEKVAQFFTESLDRIDTGLEKFSGEDDITTLTLARAQVLANRIPLQYISTMSLESDKKQYPNIRKLVEEVLSIYENSKQLASEASSAEAAASESFIDFQKYLILDTLDDLLDMVENFGVNDDLDEIDSDNEQGLDSSSVELSKKHPLYSTREKVPEYSDRLVAFLEDFETHLVQVDKEHYKLDVENKAQDHKTHSLAIIYLQVCEKLGQLYLKKADESGREYTDIVYGDEDDDEEEGEGDEPKDDGLIKTLQHNAIDNYKKAIKYLKKTEDPEEPQSWVNIAEVEISLGNIHDLNSEKQESLYKKAEKRLRKANNATNGKYEHVLKNLLEG